jgi:hypothetical protein
MEKEEEKYDVIQAFEKLDSMISNEKLPLPKKAKSFGEEYEFPEDVESIGMADLGNWMLRLSALAGYTGRLLAMKEAQRTILSKSLEVKVNSEVAKIQQASDGKKVTKEAIAAEVITNDEKLRGLKRREIDLIAACNMLEILRDVYTKQGETISRELTRRSLEMKALGGMD